MSDIINPSSGGGIDLSLSGNTTGTLALISSGTGILAGGNNITLSQNGQSITISAANQSVQTQSLINLSLGGNTAGVLTLVSSGTALLAGGNNITLSQNGQSITISGANAAAGSAAAVAIGGNSTSAGAGYSTVTSGTALFAGGNNITLSQNGASITISGANAAAGSAAAVAIGGNSTSAGAGYSTVTSGTVLFDGGNNITLSQNGSNITISAANQSAQTQNLFDLTISGNTAGTTALISSGTLTLDGGANITLSQNGNAITIVGPAPGTAQTVQTQNCVDVTIDTNANYVGTPALISSGTAIWAGGNNITLSQNGQEITIVGPSTVAQTNQTIGYSAENNTTLTTSGTIDARSLYLYGAGNVSVGFSSSSLIISGGGAAGGVDISLSGNTAGTPALISSGTAIFAGGNNITLSQNGQSITIEAPGSGAAATTVPYYELDVARGATSTQTTGAGTVYLQPFVVSVPLQIYRGQILADVTGQATTTFSYVVTNSTSAISTGAGGIDILGYSGSWGMSGTVMLLSRQSTGTAAASSNLVTFYNTSTSASLGMSMTASASATNVDFISVNATTSWAMGFISNIDSNGGVTTGSVGTSASFSASTSSAGQNSLTISTTNTYGSLYMSGIRALNFPMNTSLSPGEYWLGLIFSTSSGSASAKLQNVLSLTQFLQVFTSNTAGFLPFGASASTNNSNVQMGWGSYSSSGNTSTTFPITNVSNMSQEQTWFNLMAWTL